MSVPNSAAFADLENPYGVIAAEHVAKNLDLDGICAAGTASKRWRRVLGPREAAAAVEEEATRRGVRPPPGFWSAVRDHDWINVSRARKLWRNALRRRLLVTGAPGSCEVWAAVAMARPFSTGSSRSLTTFVVINDSGVDVWVHWVENGGGENDQRPLGRMLARPGDFLASAPRPLFEDDTSPRIFQYGPGGQCPEGVFVHTSTLSHAFVVCLKEGKQPVAVYQQRRAFLEMRTRHWRQSHVHAVRIAKVDPVEIEELACVHRLPLRADDQSRIAHFQATAKFDAKPKRAVVEPGLVPTVDRRLRLRFRSAPAPVKTYEKMANEFAGVTLPPSVEAWPDEARTIVNVVLGRDDTSYSHSPACPLDLTHLAARVEGQNLYETVWHREDRLFAAKGCSAPEILCDQLQEAAASKQDAPAKAPGPSPAA